MNYQASYQAFYRCMNLGVTIFQFGNFLKISEGILVFYFDIFSKLFVRYFYNKIFKIINACPYLDVSVTRDFLHV